MLYDFLVPSQLLEIDKLKKSISLSLDSSYIALIGSDSKELEIQIERMEIMEKK